MEDHLSLYNRIRTGIRLEQDLSRLEALAVHCGLEQQFKEASSRTGESLVHLLRNHVSRGSGRAWLSSDHDMQALGGVVKTAWPGHVVCGLLDQYMQAFQHQRQQQHTPQQELTSDSAAEPSPKKPNLMPAGKLIKTLSFVKMQLCAYYILFV
eukprot:m.181381 g.181381  ORF g.181381 m.181381 type:complete len:153 (-) comp16628_c4_seq1:1572-2030(-)